MVPLNYSSVDPPKLKKQYQQEEFPNQKLANNHNDGGGKVDEADTIQRDENFVYAAYGDYLVAWDQNGKLVTQVKIPSEGLGANADDATTTNGASNCDSNNFWCFFQLPASIRAILLTSEHALVVVESDESSSNYYNDKEGNVLSDADKSTRLCLYSKPTPDGASYTMSLLNIKDIKGRYNDGLYMPHSNAIHLVTQQNIFFESLSAPFSLDNFPKSISYDDYQKEATALALDKVIPKFVQSLADEILSENGSTPNMIRINSWRTANNPNGTRGSAASSALNGYIQIHSISVPTSKTTKMEISRSALLTPSRGHAFYGKGNFLVFVTHDDVWDATTSRHVPTTCFLTLKTRINSANNKVDDLSKTKFHSIAALPGYYMHYESIITKNRMDIQGNDLRYAVGGSVRIFSLELQGDMTADADSIRRIEVGGPGETISSIHFGTQEDAGVHSAHVMTFDDDLQTCFLYVVDLVRLRALSSQRLPDGGHFTSLQVLDNSNVTLLLGIGSNTSAGTNQDIFLAIFDLSSSSSPPRLLASHSVQSSERSWTTSLAQQDPMAADYSNGKLAVPYSMSGIDGVVVLNVDDTVIMNNTGAIPELYRVDSPGRLVVGSYYYCARSLPGFRSFVQDDGTLMTISANSDVIGTDFFGQIIWSLNVTFPEDEPFCVARTCECSSNRAVL